MQKIAEKKINTPATYEVSITNVEKPPLSYYEIQKIYIELQNKKRNSRWCKSYA